VRLIAVLIATACTLAAIEIPTTFPAGGMTASGPVLRDERNRPIVLMGTDALMIDEDLVVRGGGNATGAFFGMRSWNMNAGGS
jgi:hypothetical protein